MFSGSPAIDLDLNIQHVLEHFPRESASTKRVPREYLTDTERSDSSMKPTYSSVPTSILPTQFPTQTYAPPIKSYDTPIHSDR